MQNIELFRENARGARCDRWLTTVKARQARELLKLHDDLLISPLFGAFVYQNALCDLAPFFTRAYFSRNFTAILNALARAGTYDAYLDVIRSALGFDAVVEFDSPRAGALTIKIAMPTERARVGAMHRGAMAQLASAPAGELGVMHTIAPLTVAETVALIELLNVAGVALNIDFMS